MIFKIRCETNEQKQISSNAARKSRLDLPLEAVKLLAIRSLFRDPMEIIPNEFSEF